MSRRATTIAVAASAVAITVLLSGCAPGPAPRTRPNAAELAALAAAGNVFAPAAAAPARWVQLWTPQQAGPEITRCVNGLSNGLVTADIQLGPQGMSIALSYGLGGASVADINRFMERSAVQAVVDRCIAQTPIDDRVNALPRRDWDALYSYESTVLRRCLLSHGQPVDRLPTRARFERLLTASTPWSPYDRVVVPDRAAWYALSDACPAIPPDLTLD